MGKLYLKSRLSKNYSAHNKFFKQVEKIVKLWVLGAVVLVVALLGIAGVGARYFYNPCNEQLVTQSRTAIAYGDVSTLQELHDRLVGTRAAEQVTCRYAMIEYGIALESAEITRQNYEVYRQYISEGQTVDPYLDGYIREDAEIESLIEFFQLLTSPEDTSPYGSERLPDSR